MERVSATYRDGHVIFDSEVDWPEGTRVAVDPLEDIGISESGWPQTPEELQEWLEWFDSIEPFDMTSEELKRLDKQRRAWKHEQTELFEKNAREVEKLF